MNPAFKTKFCFYNFLLLTILILQFSNSQAAPAKKIVAKTSSNVSLGTTHMLPSAFVIPGGTLILGTTVGVGLFDVFDITTNLYLDLYNVYNVAAKFNILADEAVAFAIHASYVSQTIRTQADLSSPVVSYNATSIAPGATFSYRISPGFVGHIGGKAVIRNPELTKAAFVPKTGFVQGTTVNKEFAFALTPNTTLALGASYDLSYDIPGAGLSFFLGNLQLGAHYYFGVTDGAIQPLIGGSYTTSF